MVSLGPFHHVVCSTSKSFCHTNSPRTSHYRKPRVGVWVALLTEIVIDAAELEKLETAMIKILGVRPKYFRPPYGSYTDLVLKVLSERGYTKMFLWTDATRTSERLWTRSCHPLPRAQCQR